MCISEQERIVWRQKNLRLRVTYSQRSDVKFAWQRVRGFSAVRYANWAILLYRRSCSEMQSCSTESAMTGTVWRAPKWSSVYFASAKAVWKRARRISTLRLVCLRCSRWARLFKNAASTLTSCSSLTTRILRKDLRHIYTSVSRVLRFGDYRVALLLLQQQQM